MTLVPWAGASRVMSWAAEPTENWTRSASSNVIRTGATLTIFDNLNFTYTSHLKLMIDPATGVKRAVNVTVLGRCNGGTGAWTF